MIQSNLDNISFIELLLAIIELEYKNQMFYYGELGEFILLCKSHQLFSNLLSSFTYKKIDDASYYYEILLPIENIIHKKEISSIDTEYIFLAKNFPTLYILKKNRKYIREMQNFLKEYFIYIQNIDAYQKYIEEKQIKEKQETKIDWAYQLFHLKNEMQNESYKR